MAVLTMRSFVPAAVGTAALLTQSVCAFTLVPSVHQTTLPRTPPALFAAANVEEAAALKAQAERMRLEAEKLDAQLTLEKINTLEKKLNDTAWRKRHPEKESELRQQLDNLNRKLQGKPPIVQTKSPVETRVTFSETVTASAPEPSSIDSLTAETATASATESSRTDSLMNAESVSTKVENKNPLTGFDAADLELYLPVARQIEKDMKNATVDQQLQAFRETPELQQHFSDKIQALLVGPMEDMQKLEGYKSQYLASTSSVEKEQLKRQIDALESTINKDSPFVYSTSVFRKIPKMSDEELQERTAALEALPKLLQCLYKKRNDVSEKDDLSLAILVEHYEPQIQLLDQVKLVTPLDSESRKEAKMAYESLPLAVQRYFLQKLNLPLDSGTASVIQELEGGISEISMGSFGKVVVEASKAVDLPEYSDVEFLDRSRYIEEFIPAFCRMESTRPSEEEIKTFCSEVLDKTTYTLTSKPERVMGGYYLRGESRLEGDGAGDKLVEKLSERLEKSSVKDDLQFFFIPDPTQLTDEEIESGNVEVPLLAVTSKNSKEFYNPASTQTKIMVSTLGIISTLVFALASCGMNVDMMDRVQQGIDSGGTMDITWFADVFFTTFASMLGIQLVHEVAHRIVALKDGFDVGFPNLVPSLSLGVTGSITSLKSPPKNWNSMYDFAVAGPLAGIVASLYLLTFGLGITATMDISSQSQLPALPVLLLRASALGGGLIETFLGTGVLSSSATPETVLPMHPFAIAGFAGLLINALALLPVGHTDGGRMALAIFGRRGFFLVKTFSLIAICTAGLFGLDNADILLLYALFVVLWQRELETPALNEVDDLSTARGLAAFPIIVLVALSLLPLP